MEIKQVEISSTNYGGENRGRLFVVVHANVGTAEGTVSWFRNENVKGSYHYLITLEGEIWQLVDESERAYHAGVSSFDGYTDLNDLSIGVCIESYERTESEVTEAQYEALLELIRNIKERYDIKTDYVRGHKEVSPGRKSDPKHIDMDKLRRDLDDVSDEDTIKTLVLHNFDDLSLESGQVVVRGKMRLNRRGEKLDIRFLD